MRDDTRPRGRTREYEEAEVLEAVSTCSGAMAFSGAILPDLAAAAGITRPSLYTVLGYKLSMYLRSLEHFEQGLRAQLVASLSLSRPLADGLLDFYTVSINLFDRNGGQPRGCLVLCTAVAEAHEEPKVRAVLARLLRVLD